VSASFDRLKSVTASTKREGAVVGGLSGSMATNIASLSCLPIDPLSPEAAQTVGLEAWVGLYQTMVDGSLDIVAGDQFIVGSVTYKVRAVANWYWFPDEENTTVVVLELLV